MTSCAICKHAATQLSGDVDDTAYFDCPVCGRFGITDEAYAALNGSDDLLYRLSVYSRQGQMKGIASVFCSSPTAAALKSAGASPKSRRVALQDAMAFVPESVVERLDSTLLTLAAKSRRPGELIKLELEVDYPLVFCDSAETALFFLQQLSKRGFVDLGQNGSARTCRLLLEGWSRVEDLQRGKVGAELDRAFIAMWFAAEGREEREKGLVGGISAAGFKAPFIADREEYGGKIDDKIVAEIRRCRFLVADLTGQRNNVYFEAGFAEGIGRPVIYTCSEDYLDKCAFDKRQENIIVWKTSEELKSRLAARITAIIGFPA